MSWTREQRKEAERILNYEYLTQTEETWQEGPYDAVKLALAILAIPGVDMRGLAPVVYNQIVAILSKYSELDRLWGTVPEHALKDLYMANYGPYEWLEQYEEDKKEHGRPS